MLSDWLFDSDNLLRAKKQTEYKIKKDKEKRKLAIVKQIASLPNRLIMQYVCTNSYQQM